MIPKSGIRFSDKIMPNLTSLTPINSRGGKMKQAMPDCLPRR
jgi:hypothetical protein